MSDLEQTQAIHLEDYDEETDEEVGNGEKKIVSFLKVLKQDEFPEKLYPLYDGDNVIGRQENTCSVVIPLKALSREHACIEIHGENHLIYDKGSRNKTKRGKFYLIPEVRYELKDKDALLFGDVNCVYIIGEPENTVDSETGSESGFQTAPTDPIGSGTGKSPQVTTLVYESEEDQYDSDNSVDLLQPTQAYVQRQDGNKKSRINFDMDTDEDESDKKSPDITVKETPAPRKTKGFRSAAVILPESGSETEEEDGGKQLEKKSLLLAPTQAFLAESEGETTEEDSPKKKILCAETQSFLEDKGKKTRSPHGIILESENEEDKDGDVPVVEIEEEEENSEDKSHLFANPTLACDLPEEEEEYGEDQDTEKESHETEEDPEAETQAVNDQTVAVTDETLDVSAVKGKSNVRVAVDKKKQRNAKDALQVENAANAATQKFSDGTDGDTLAVDKDECDATQLFDNKVTEAETVAMECEATLALNKKVSDMNALKSGKKATEAETVEFEYEATQDLDDKAAAAETVAMESEATQAFSRKIVEAETVPVECDATQILEEKITEVETAALECEATQVLDEKVSEVETVPVECDATQVLDEKGAELGTTSFEVELDVKSAQDEDMVVDDSSTNEKQAATVVVEAETDVNIHNAETVPVGCDETQVLEDLTTKESKDSPLKTVAVECEPTQILSDAQGGGEKSTDEVVKKRGRGKKGTSKTETKPSVPEDHEEVQPKRSGRLSKRKSLQSEDKPIEKTQEASKKGRGKRGKGGNKVEDIAEETDEDRENTTEKESDGEKKTTEDEKECITEKTTDAMDGTNSKLKNLSPEKGTNVKDSTGPMTKVSDEEIEPTQAYCMEIDDQEESNTPPISDVLGVEVEDGTPKEPVKFMDSEPDILPIPIPPSSPHRSALASPHRKSPTPKKVHFEKRESEFVLNEKTGSKLKTEIENKVPMEKAGGRTRRSLPNLSQPAGPSKGRRGRSSVDPMLKVEDMDEPTKAKGRRGRAKAQKPSNEESTKKGGRENHWREVNEEETPPLEETENASEETQAIDKESTSKAEQETVKEAVEIKGKGKRGRTKAQKPCNEETTKKGGRGNHLSEVIEEETPPLEEIQAFEKESTPERVSIGEHETVKETVEIKGKGKRGKRGSKAPAVVDKDPSGVDNEQSEEINNQRPGTSQKKDKEKVEEPTKLEGKVVKSGRGKRKKNETSEAEEIDKNEFDDFEMDNKQSKTTKNKDSGKELKESLVEESVADEEDSSKTQSTKRTRGRKSILKPENIPSGKRGGRRSKVEEKTEEEDKQTSNENFEEESEREKTEENKISSRKSRKRDTLVVVNEETLTDSQQSSSSSRNKKSIKGTLKEDELKDMSEEVQDDDKVASESESKPVCKGRSNKIEEVSDVADSGKSQPKGKRKSVTKHRPDNEDNSEESQESVLSTETTMVRRGRGKAHPKQTSESQDSETSSGPTRKSRARESSVTKKAEEESESQELIEKKDSKTVKPSSKSRKSNVRDTSAVDLDTEMSSDSQDSSQTKAAKRGRGRHKTDEAKDEVSAKKTKMEPPSTPQHEKKSTKYTDSPSASLRRTSIIPSKPKVMFTVVTNEQGQKVVKDLGGHLVDAVHECTHLVTDKVRRTVKFLCCLARGIPIVNPLWLDSCKSSGMFVDHTPFLIKDEAAERQHKFVLHLSLEKASESSLLSGYKIHVTKSVKPDPANMKDIITCAGGEYLTTMPKKAGDKVLVISCPDDKAGCDSAIKAGITIVNAEFILTGILRQENAAENYILFEDKKRSRDSSVGGPPNKKRR
uniref:Mediator of DNA damage checkpoint protein 1 n=1 Tax=Crassostrea virginica TaxID=6565 RepID=A0A8B8CE97_CRAVI|nr:mediator of DNA damage checkpoint protein 1-like isoform X2 [Crassostrea virginica]